MRDALLLAAYCASRNDLPILHVMKQTMLEDVSNFTFLTLTRHLGETRKCWVAVQTSAQAREHRLCYLKLFKPENNVGWRHALIQTDGSIACACSCS